MTSPASSTVYPPSASASLAFRLSQQRWSSASRSSGGGGGASIDSYRTASPADVPRDLGAIYARANEESIRALAATAAMAASQTRRASAPAGKKSHSSRVARPQSAADAALLPHPPLSPPMQPHPPHPLAFYSRPQSAFMAGGGIGSPHVEEKDDGRLAVDGLMFPPPPPLMALPHPPPAFDASRPASAATPGAWWHPDSSRFDRPHTAHPHSTSRPSDFVDLDAARRGHPPAHIYMRSARPSPPSTAPHSPPVPRATRLTINTGSSPRHQPASSPPPPAESMTPDLHQPGEARLGIPTLSPSPSPSEREAASEAHDDVALVLPGENAAAQSLAAPAFDPTTRVNPASTTIASTRPTTGETRPHTSATVRSTLPPSVSPLAPPPTAGHARVQALLLQHASRRVPKEAEEARARDRVVHRLLAARAAREEADFASSLERARQAEARQHAEWARWRALKRETVRLHKRQQAFQRRRAEREAAKRGGADREEKSGANGASTEVTKDKNEVGAANATTTETASRGDNSVSPPVVAVPESVLRAVQEQALIAKCDADLKLARERIGDVATSDPVQQLQEEESTPHLLLSTASPPILLPSPRQMRPRHKKAASMMISVRAPSISPLGSGAGNSPISDDCATPPFVAPHPHTHTRAASVAVDSRPRVPPLALFGATSFLAPPPPPPTTTHAPLTVFISPFTPANTNTTALTSPLSPTAAAAVAAEAVTAADEPAYYGFNYAYGSSVRESAYDAPPVAIAPERLQLLRGTSATRRPNSSSARRPASGTRPTSGSASGRASAPGSGHNSRASTARRSRAPVKDAPAPIVPPKDALLEAALRQAAPPPTAPAFFAFQSHRIVPFQVPTGSSSGGGGGGGKGSRASAIDTIVGPVTTRFVPPPPPPATRPGGARTVTRAASRAVPRHAAPTSSPSRAAGVDVAPTTDGSEAPPPPKPSVPRAFMLALHEFERQKEMVRARRAKHARGTGEGDAAASAGAQLYSGANTTTAAAAADPAVASPNQATTTLRSHGGSSAASPVVTGGSKLGSSVPATPVEEEDDSSAALDRLGVPAWQLASPRHRTGPRLMRSDRRAAERAERDPTRFLRHDDPSSAHRVVAVSGGFGVEERTSWHDENMPITRAGAHISNDEVVAAAGTMAAGVERALVDAVFRHMPRLSLSLDAPRASSPRNSSAAMTSPTGGRQSPHSRRRPSSMFSGPPVPLHVRSASRHGRMPSVSERARSAGRRGVDFEPAPDTPTVAEQDANDDVALHNTEE